MKYIVKMKTIKELIQFDQFRGINFETYSDFYGKRLPNWMEKIILEGYSEKKGKYRSYRFITQDGKLYLDLYMIKIIKIETRLDKL